MPPGRYIKQRTPPDAYHVKYGMIDDDPFWILKVAGGPSKLPLSGMMIAFSTQTGKPEAVLMDDGYLTQLRTAVSGSICAKYLAPKSISAIGILGTGQQARMQAEILKNFTDFRTIYAWGRTMEKVNTYKKDMENIGFNVCIARSPSEIAYNCNLIVTTTASCESLIKAEDIKPGTHITAIGTDAPGKQEIDHNIFSKVDIIAADSKRQCIDHGEIHKAYTQKLITDKNLIELGEILINPKLGRTTDHQITIADLTGVAIQDIQIAKAIL